MISIVIPAFNEASTIESTLRHLACLTGEYEVVVVENGSTDDTFARAQRLAPTIQGPHGRGPAMNAGAAATHGETLLFLHADTLLPLDALRAVNLALADAEVAGGCFSVGFDGDDWRSAVVGALYAGLGRFGLAYGDGAIFVRRQVFEELGGFAPRALMEDVDFWRRLRKQGKVVRLGQRVLTSDRRWRRQGLLRTAIVYLTIQGLYLAGLTSPALFGLYKPTR